MLKVYFFRQPDVTTRMWVEVNQRLQWRGSDFMVYANDGYTPEENDSDLLQHLMSVLLTDTSGVESIKVTPFSLEIYHSRAISFCDLKARLAIAFASGSPSNWELVS